MNGQVWITRDNVTKLLSVAALLGGAYAGWTLMEGQHVALKVLVALLGAGICCSTADWILN